MTAPSPFDVCGPLPTGTTVLEASAGTGKTFAIAALAARYVAEGHARLPELMLVTFSRAATAELRERIRDRFVTAERGLARLAAGRGAARPDVAGDDMLLARLADAGDDEVADRRQRLADALAGFDAATIATTHEFCQQMRAGLGISADTDPGAAFVEDLNDLVTEVVDDLYVREYAAGSTAEPALRRGTALDIARAAISDFQARLEPSTAPADSDAAVRYRFAAAAREEFARRKRQRRLYGYDDMLTGLEAALLDAVTGPAACARLRERYTVVLVDEFQDTDPVQWNILRTAFHGHRTLVLIGDPKQAIYGFRGADVVSYLSASDAAGAHATLAVNWRSDEPLVDALQTVFGGAALGDLRITVHPARAAHRGVRLRGAPVDAPLRIRLQLRAGQPLNTRGLLAAEDARAAVTADVAADIGRLLSSGATLDGEAVSPGKVAVLVRAHQQASQVQDALTEAGIPAVLGSAGSVFGAPAAGDWLALLEGLEQPHRANRIAAAALSGVVGWTAEQLTGASEAEREALGATLKQWQATLATRGVAALLEAVTAPGLAARLLATRRGERQLTDLRHVGLALHAAAVDGQLGLTALVAWLRRRIEEAPRDQSLDRARRLESDAEAVQIITVHSSKGLQFPVVYVPFGSDRHVSEPDLLRYHDGGARTLNVGGKAAPDRARWCRRHHAEEAGEDLRLLYVALTRAECQVVTWWAATQNARKSALHRLLFGGRVAGATPDEEYPVPADSEVLDRLRALASPEIAIEQVGEGAAHVWSAPTLPREELAAARFRRPLDTRWRRTSYSRLTAAAHDGPGVGSEPEEDQRDDEAAPELAPAAGAGPAGARPAGAGPAGADLPSPMADLPGGAAFGTLIHAILETTDPTAPDLLAELTERAREQVVRYPSRLDPAALAGALMPAFGTSLGPLAGGRALRDIAPRDRLAELDFELPLDGGDRAAASGSVTLGDVGDVLGRHLSTDDPLGGYGELLREPVLATQRLRGYLAGSIDAVLRVDGPRYLVVDYKTNRLGGPDISALDYHPRVLTRAMTAAHYPLQALLYCVALHRFLRWRQPGYDPAQHLGGVLYLFLRGMCGPGTPAVGGVACGVFSWHPPAALVEDLSVLLDGGPR